MADPSRFLRWSVINQWLQQDRWHQGIEVPSFPPIVTKFTIAASVPSVIYLSIPFHFELFLMELVEGNICKNTLDLWVQNHSFMQIFPSINPSILLLLNIVLRFWIFKVLVALVHPRAFFWSQFTMIMNPNSAKTRVRIPINSQLPTILNSSNPIHTQIDRIISYSISFVLTLLDDCISC